MSLNGTKKLLKFFVVFYFLKKNMQRVALLNWKNKNKDYDLSKIFQSLASPWVVEWLDYNNWKITPWFAFVEVERQGIRFCILFENTENLPIDSTWTKKVFIEILNEKILDGSSNNIDWTEIWFIKTAPNFPEKNFLKLGRFEDWYFHSEKQILTTRNDLNITKQWNDFNGANQLLKLNSSGKIDNENMPLMNIDINWHNRTNFWNNQEFLVYDKTLGANRKVESSSFFDKFETKYDFSFFTISKNTGDEKIKIIEHNLWKTPKFITLEWSSDRRENKWFYISNWNITKQWNPEWRKIINFSWSNGGYYLEIEVLRTSSRDVTLKITTGSYWAWFYNDIDFIMTLQW